MARRIGEAGGEANFNRSTATASPVCATSTHAGGFPTSPLKNDRSRTARRAKALFPGVAPGGSQQVIDHETPSTPHPYTESRHPTTRS